MTDSPTLGKPLDFASAQSLPPEQAAFFHLGPSATVAEGVHKSGGHLGSAHIYANHPAGFFARVHHGQIFTVTFSSESGGNCRA